MKRIGYAVAMLCRLVVASEGVIAENNSRQNPLITLIIKKRFMQLAHLRYFFAVLFLSMHSTAQADCVDIWLSYSSPIVDTYVSYEHGCYQGDLLIDFEVKAASIKSKKGVAKFTHELSGSISFNQECTVLKRSSQSLITTTTMFRCRNDGKTPLAGATYKLFNDGVVIDCGEPVGSGPSNIFRCIAGCGSFTPPVLYTLNGCD